MNWRLNPWLKIDFSLSFLRERVKCGVLVGKRAEISETLDKVLVSLSFAQSQSVSVVTTIIFLVLISLSLKIYETSQSRSVSVSTSTKIFSIDESRSRYLNNFPVLMSLGLNINRIFQSRKILKNQS